MTLLDKVLLVLVLYREITLRVLETVVGIKRREVGVGLVVDGEIVRVARESGITWNTGVIKRRIGDTICRSGTIRIGTETSREDHVGVLRGRVGTWHATGFLAGALKCDGFGRIHLRATACGAR